MGTCITRRRKLTGLGLLLAVAIVGVGLLSFPSRPQVVGVLAPADLREILGIVQKELRTQLLPPFEWYSFRNPGYSISRLRQYRAQHILWLEARGDGGVDVYAGVSKDVIRNEGHHWLLRRGPNWSITGYSYWDARSDGYASRSSSNDPPADIHVPPSP